MKTRWYSLLFFGVLTAFPSLSKAGDPTGLSDLLKPIAILAAPVVMPVVLIKNAIYGTDKAAIEHWEKEQEKILKTHSKVRSEGIFGDSGIMTQQNVFQLLASRKFHYVEAPVRDIQWLVKEAAFAGAIQGAAEGKSIARFRLAPFGDHQCFTWREKVNDWTQRPPVVPGTCLVVEFDELTPRSRYAVRLDISKASARELYWELVDLKEDLVELRLPFWQAQYEGTPLRVQTWYLPTQTLGSPLALLLREIEPTDQPVPPRVLTYRQAFPYYLWVERQGELLATVRPRTRSLPQSSVVSEEEWAAFFRYTTSSGTPQVNRKLLALFPARGYVVQLPYELYGPRMVTECCIIQVANRASNRGINLSAETYEGVHLWSLHLISGYPTSPDGKSSFYSTGISIDGDELFVFGGDQEWVVPLDALPKLPN